MKELWSGIIATVLIAFLAAAVLSGTEDTTAERFSTSSVRL